MIVNPRETYAELFARKAEITRELQMRITEELRASELAEREKNREKQEEATWQYIAAVIATEAQIEAFTTKLDRYMTRQPLKRSWRTKKRGWKSSGI